MIHDPGGGEPHGAEAMAQHTMALDGPEITGSETTQHPSRPALCRDASLHSCSRRRDPAIVDSDDENALSVVVVTNFGQLVAGFLKTFGDSKRF